MHELGVQPTERDGEHGFLDRAAPLHDRERIRQAQRVQPPDAFHPGRTARLYHVANAKKYRDGLGESIRSYASRTGYGVTQNGLSGPNGSPASSIGFGLGFGYGSNSNRSFLNSGYNGYGSSYGFRSLDSGVYGTASPSSLLHGGSPSDPGAQAGSPRRP